MQTEIEQEEEEEDWNSNKKIEPLHLDSFIEHQGIDFGTKKITMSNSALDEVLSNDATAQKIPLVQAALGNDVTLGDMIKIQPLFKEYWEHFSAKQPDLSGWKPKDKLLKYEKELRAIWVPRNNIAKTWTQIEVNNEPTNLYFEPEYAKRVFLKRPLQVVSYGTFSAS